MIGMAIAIVVAKRLCYTRLIARNLNIVVEIPISLEHSKLCWVLRRSVEEN